MSLHTTRRETAARLEAKEGRDAMRTDAEALADLAVRKRLMALWMSSPPTRASDNLHNLRHSADAHASIVYALESALLEPGGFALFVDTTGYAVASPFGMRRLGDGPSRLEALLAACEAMAKP